MNSVTPLMLAGALVFAVAGMSPVHAAVDEKQALEQIETNKCGKCHAPAKTKSGPSWAKVAAKYKDKPDGEDKIILNITTSPKVKLADGSEEEHKVIKTKDPLVLKNLAQWILAH